MANKGLQAGSKEKKLNLHLYFLTHTQNKNYCKDKQINKRKLLRYKEMGYIFIFILIPWKDFSGSVGWQTYGFDQNK